MGMDAECEEIATPYRTDITQEKSSEKIYYPLSDSRLFKESGTLLKSCNLISMHKPVWVAICNKAIGLVPTHSQSTPRAWNNKSKWNIECTHDKMYNKVISVDGDGGSRWHYLLTHQLNILNTVSLYKYPPKPRAEIPCYHPTHISSLERFPIGIPTPLTPST